MAARLRAKRTSTTHATAERLGCGSAGMQCRQVAARVFPAACEPLL